MRLGDVELLNLTDGCFRLDGGAMFGIVPKPLWEKTSPPDRQNRILLNLGVLLIRAGGTNILVDSGAGNKYDAKALEMYAIEHHPSLEDSIKRVELTTEDNEIVINTHLHFDHAGGNTVRRPDGSLVQTFPRARYYIQKGEWEAAFLRNERTRRSYHRRDFEPLQRSQCINFLDGDRDILPEVRVMITPGHTEYHQSVVIKSRDEKGIFPGDLIPTASHVSLPYIMGYDILPLVTLETKRKILQHAWDEKWLLIFQHDPRIRTGRVICVNGKFMVEPVEEGNA